MLGGKQVVKSTTICIPRVGKIVDEDTAGVAVDVVCYELIDSNRCHFVWFCMAAFICVHNSFLHDFDLNFNKFCYFHVLIWKKKQFNYLRID